MAGERIAVLGLGRMGAALASTLLHRGYAVTVWNRTASKAAPLVLGGATQATSPAAAIAAADMVLICVGNYTDTNQILSGCDELRGKTIIQLTTGRSQEAAALQTWVEARGGGYLDGSILAYPSQIGHAETMIVVAGAQRAWAAAEHIIRSLGGGSLYVGLDVSAPIALGFALAAPSLMAMVGMLLGFHALERAGVSPRILADSIPGITHALTGDLDRQARAILRDDFSATEASLSAWAAAFGDTWATELDSTDARVRGEDVGAILRPISALLNRGVAAGFGEEDLTAVLKVLRHARN